MDRKPESQPFIRDLRRYARQTNVQLVVGALLVLFIIGDGLIAIIYGPNAALFGLLCLGAGLIPVVLIILAMFLIDWVVRRARSE